MTQVLTFESYTPVSRFDAVPWANARIDQATTSTGSWTTIDTVALSPVDADPSNPATRNITTALASSTMGLWYRIVFLDGSGNVSQPTSPVQNSSPTPVQANTPMTFLDLQDAVMDGAFAEDKRDQVKNAINVRYGGIVDEEEWTFIQASSNVSVAANSRTVTNVPGDFSTALSIQRADGTWLRPIDEYRDFASLYIGGTNIPTGLPEAFCVVGSDVFVGPTSSETSDTYLLVYERVATLMVDDDDTPIIPSQYHMGLVYDAKGTMYALADEALAQNYGNLARTVYAPMRRKYLKAIRGSAKQAPAYRPGW